MWVQCMCVHLQTGSREKVMPEKRVHVYIYVQTSNFYFCPFLFEKPIMTCMPSTILFSLAHEQQHHAISFYSRVDLRNEVTNITVEHIPS